MVSTGCLKFPPIWSKGRVGWGMWQRLCGLEGKENICICFPTLSSKEVLQHVGRFWETPESGGVEKDTDEYQSVAQGLGTPFLKDSCDCC